MLFIALAILVLGLSFVLALLSLVREQNRLNRSQQEQPESKEQSPQETVKRLITNASINPIKKTIEKPPVFQNRQNINISPNEQQAIENIKAELAKIAQEGKTEDGVIAKEPLATIQEVSQDTATSELEQNLTGEIFPQKIRDNN